ncbi:farnesol dehydrogenase-like [Maniola hyperantus]|uniref:farnesol dehydrogenase-like n=1 Tax=Aphantopus hyperantus TaxID=2795564 RepID=UPI00156A46C4|nr:farnesol dehydrogenase-like isoform X2 [Maniola hyperantus]XP_034827954.1 farnesol dehydrogenase-like isoform X2 [Maniola hyperantus]
MERWSNKVAVVTGASSGIGAALSVRLADHGMTVVGLARRAHLVDKLNTEVKGAGKIVSRKCDISNVDEIQAAFEWVENKFGGTDVLVNNAGIFIPGKITDAIDGKLSDDVVLLTMDVNYKGIVMCTRQAVASMKKRNFDGHIININSLAGHYIPFHSDFNIYSSTKHAVTAFTAALLNEMADAKRKIKVTSISPGLVRTEITAGHSADQPILEPSEVADTILYVLSTPPNVNISELEVLSTAEKKL